MSHVVLALAVPKSFAKRPETVKILIWALRAKEIVKRHIVAGFAGAPRIRIDAHRVQIGFD